MNTHYDIISRIWPYYLLFLNRLIFHYNIDELQFEEEHQYDQSDQYEINHYYNTTM